MTIAVDLGRKATKQTNKLPAEDTSCYWYVILQYSKHSYNITTRVANKLDPDQARRFIGLDLGPNCL